MTDHTLYEVWGDTVDGRHLASAIAIGAFVSVGAFEIAQWVLVELVASPQMARAYAMLAGILGCLLGGAISALLFKPKRRVVQGETDLASRMHVIEELRKERGGLGSVADLSPDVIAELKELGLYTAFAEAEATEPGDRIGADTPAQVSSAGIALTGGRT